MNNFISVIISTHNPHPGRLALTLNGLKNQTLTTADWELIIIDNNSMSFPKTDLDWPRNCKIIRESRLGLTFARLRGINESQGETIVFVDDDNILNESYLQAVSAIFRENMDIGAIGGKSLPDFEFPPPKWINQFFGNLALRDFGDDIVIESWRNVYPKFAPIGAGLAFRKKAITVYLEKMVNGVKITDRQGTSLGSSGDNDIIIDILKSGWRVGYFPMLSLIHLIPQERLQIKYLAKLTNNTNRSWIKLLDMHDINPWNKIPRWTVLFRKVKAWFTYKAWLGNAHYIKWKGACGTFDGLADEIPEA